MLDIENNAKKALLTFAVEKVLLKMGKPEYELVLNKLENDYSSYISDCHENPEFLKRVLQYIYGNSYDDIIKEIEKELGGFIFQNYYRNFLQALLR